MMVLMTTVVLGGVMSAFAKIIGLKREEDEEDLGGTHDSRISKMSDIVFKGAKKKSWLQKKFHLLDDKILKPCFGGDMSKLEKHKEERRLEEERRNQYLKLQGIKNTQRQTENVAQDSHRRNKLSEDEDISPTKAGNQHDEYRSNTFMKGKLS
jgi:hypothetical protein